MLRHLQVVTLSNRVCVQQHGSTASQQHFTNLVPNWQESNAVQSASSPLRALSGLQAYAAHVLV
jgi:hypothetical protein